MISLGFKICAKADRSFDHTFQHQYIISQSADHFAPGWNQVEVKGWNIFHSPSLPVTQLKDKYGEVVGFLLGCALDVNGESLREECAVLADENDPHFFNRFENFLDGLSGRFLCILATKEIQRIYPDPVVDLGCVYDPLTRTVASSLTLALTRDFQPDQIFGTDLSGNHDRRQTMGHTLDRHVKRLCANIYLDLKSFQTHRFWPREDTNLFENPRDKSIEISEQIAVRLGQLTSGWVKSHKCLFPISGGRDSRSLLASISNDLSKVDGFYTWSFHKQSRWDVKIGRKIADLLSLPHQIFRNVEISKDDASLYELRTGYAVPSMAERSLGISEKLPGGSLVLRGNIMEVLRATNWQRQSTGSFNLKHALKRLRAFSAEYTGDRKIWEAEFMKWYSALPQMAKERVYDLLFLEIYLPHTQGARLYGTPQNFVVNPFNDRRLLQLSMQIDRRFKLQDRVYDHIVRSRMPQLSEIQYI